MEFSDFVQHFSRISVLDRTNDEDLQLDVKEGRGCLGPCLGCTQGCLRFFCCCHGASTFLCGYHSNVTRVNTVGGGTSIVSKSTDRQSRG
jgi:hypothetical protein